MHEKQATSLSSSFTPTRIKLKKENRNTKKEQPQTPPLLTKQEKKVSLLTGGLIISWNGDSIIL